MSTSKTGRPSSMPVAVGSIAGCEGGAVTGGSLLGSGPSSTLDLPSSEDDTGAVGGTVIVGVARGFETGVLVCGGWAAGGAPRSRGVYSVVNDGPGWGARTRRLETTFTSGKRRRMVAKPFWGVEFVRAGGLFGLKRDGNEEDRRDAWATHRKSRLRFAGSIINSMSCVSSSTYEGHV